MNNFKIRQRVGGDGILHIQISVGIPNQEVEATVSYQTIQNTMIASASLQELYGACMDDPISLDSQGVSEILDDDLVGIFDS